MNFSDLADHSGTLVSIIGSFALLCVALIGAIYKLNTRMTAGIVEKLEHHLDDSKKCQASLPYLYAPKVDTEACIAKIFSRQDKLRDEVLPQSYVLRNEMLAWNVVNENGFKAITARLDLVCQKLDRIK